MSSTPEDLKKIIDEVSDLELKISIKKDDYSKRIEVLKKKNRILKKTERSSKKPSKLSKKGQKMLLN